MADDASQPTSSPKEDEKRPSDSSSSPRRAVERRFIYGAVFVGLCFGYVLFSTPLFVLYYNALQDCGRQLTRDGCLAGRNAGCLWINETCLFPDYESVNCSLYNNASDVCQSPHHPHGGAASSSPCTYLWPKHQCLHKAGWTELQIGVFAAGTVSGGIFAPALVEKIAHSRGHIVTTSICSACGFVSALLFTIGIETEQYGLWVSSKALSSVVTFVAISLLPEILVEAGVPSRDMPRLIRIMGVMIGVAAFAVALFLFISTPRGNFAEDPKFKLRLQIFNILEWLTGVGYLLFRILIQQDSHRIMAVVDDHDASPSASDMVADGVTEKTPLILPAPIIGTTTATATTENASPKKQRDQKAEDLLLLKKRSSLLPISLEQQQQQQQQSASSPRSTKTINKKASPSAAYRVVTPQLSKVTPAKRRSGSGLHTTEQHQHPSQAKATEENSASSPSAAVVAASQQQQQYPEKEEEKTASPTSSSSSMAPGVSFEAALNASESSEKLQRDRAGKIQEQNDDGDADTVTEEEEDDDVVVVVVATASSLDHCLMYIGGVCTPFLQQLSGVAAVSSYTPIIMQQVTDDPLLAQLFFAIGLPVGACSSLFLFTKYTTPLRVFIVSGIICCVASVIIGIAMLPHAAPESSKNALAVLGIVLFSVAFGAGPSALFIASLVEIYTLPGVLGRGVAISASLGALSQAVLRLVFPLFVASISGDVRIGRGIAFFSFAVLGTASAVGLLISLKLRHK